MHELGHWADWIYITATSSKDKVASDSAWVQANLTDNQNVFNSLQACGSGGIFTGQLDSFNNYICDGTEGTGTGLNTSAGYTANEKSYLVQTAIPPKNASVLLQAWPTFETTVKFSPADRSP